MRPAFKEVSPDVIDHMVLAIDLFGLLLTIVVLALDNYFNRRRKLARGELLQLFRTRTTGTVSRKTEPTSTDRPNGSGSLP
jgi:hypothetical protein